MQFTWIEGRPVNPGLYVLNLGYKFLRSDLGYQYHYASAFFDGTTFRSTFDGQKIETGDVEGYAVLPEVRYEK